MYCVLNERGKFGAKIFTHYTDIVVFVLGYFNLNHPLAICMHVDGDLITVVDSSDLSFAIQNCGRVLQLTLFGM